jgi:hypothetical protein
MLAHAAGVALATLVIVSAPTSSGTYGTSAYVSPTPQDLGQAVAGQQQQLTYQQQYLLYLYQQRVAAGLPPTTPEQLVRAASDFFTNGAEATSVPTSGPGAAFYNNGAGLYTTPPASFPSIANPTLGAGAFGDSTQGAVSPTPSAVPSEAPSAPPPVPSAAPTATAPAPLLPPQPPPPNASPYAAPAPTEAPENATP